MKTQDPGHSPPRPDSRKQILITAGELFAQQGFRATTLRQIAQGSGANGALVSYYFGGKEGLKDAILEDYLQGFRRLHEDETLDSLLPSLLLQMREERKFLQLARVLLAEDRRIEQELWDPLLQRFTLLLGKAGGFAEPEAATRGMALMALVQKYGELLSKENTPASSLRAFERYVLEEFMPELCRS